MVADQMSDEQRGQVEEKEMVHLWPKVFEGIVVNYIIIIIIQPA